MRIWLIKQFCSRMSSCAAYFAVELLKSATPLQNKQWHCLNLRPWFARFGFRHPVVLLGSRISKFDILFGRQPVTERSSEQVLVRGACYEYHEWVPRAMRWLNVSY